MSELKNCPFCGGEATLVHGICELDNYVVCQKCLSKTKVFNTKESAIKTWNTRRPVERILERLEEKGAECKERAKEELNEFCLEMFHAYENEADGIKKAIEIIKEEVG